MSETFYVYNLLFTDMLFTPYVQAVLFFLVTGIGIKFMRNLR